MAQWVKNLPGDARDTREAGLIPGLRRSPGEGMATHPSIVAWTMDRGALWATIHGVARKSQKRLKQLVLSARV